MQKKIMGLFIFSMLLLTSFSISQAANLATSQKTMATKKSLEKKSAFQGGDIAGGGSVYESEFKAVFDNLIGRFEAAGIWRHPNYGGKSNDDLIAVLKKVKVNFAEQDLFVLIDGVKKDVDAVNFPKSYRIEGDSRRWIRLNKEERENIVLHEFYGLLEIERNIYTESRFTLASLRGLENPKRAEDECPTEVMGTHEGDGCLYVLIDVQGQYISALQDVLLKFSKPHKNDDEDTASDKARVRKFIKAQRANMRSVISAQCDLLVTSEGNMAAYEESACEFEMGEKVLGALRQYYNEIKSNYPLPEPAPIKGWNG